VSRVVLDANILIAAAISPAGVPARIVTEWEDGAFDLIVSSKLLAQVDRILRSTKLQGRVPDSDVEDFLRRLGEHAVVVDDPPEIEPVVSADPEDDFLVAPARAAGADVIVTGDRHLLDLPGLRPPALGPRAFLEILRRHVR